MMCHGLLTALGSVSGKEPGEALLWQPSRAHHSCRVGLVAVDLGKTIDMGRQVAAARPGLLILTHDDADHIGGWSGYKQGGLDGLVELWVPYEWGVLLQVVQGLRVDSEDDAPVLEEEDLIAELKRVGMQLGPDQTKDAGEDKWDTPSIEAVREGLANADFLSALGAALKEIRPERGEYWRWRGSPSVVARRATRRAVKLSEILYDAKAKGVRIRYFSVDHLPTSTKIAPWNERVACRDVTIANAVEVYLSRPLKPSVRKLAHLVRLTVQNRRALCPVLWDCCCGTPAVMVWSDSSGEWIQHVAGVDELLDHVSVSTAPHHGSTNVAHNPAWRALRGFLDSSRTVMVLAGGQNNQCVRGEYLQFPVLRRACTRCRHDPAEPRSHHVQVDVNRHGYSQIRCGGCRE